MAPKQWKIFVGIGTGIGLAALVGFSLRRPAQSKNQIQLSQLVPQASFGPLLACNGKLGSFEATPFLGRGWGEHTDLEVRTTQRRAGTSDAQIRFYLTQPESLTVELEGRSAAGEADCPVLISLAGGLSQPFKLGADWTNCKLTFSSENLKIGLNQLDLKSERPTDWRKCSFRLPNSGSIVERPTDHEPIRLGFGSSLDFPISPAAGTSLVFDQIVPWIEPGAPSLQKPWSLSIVLNSGGPSSQKSEWTLTGSGSQRIDLPVTNTGPMTLSLMAKSSDSLLPGQSGLVLQNARLESAAPPTKPGSDQSSLLQPTPPKSKPNVVLFVVDTLRSDALHCYGAQTQSTQNFDALAVDGVRFANCSAQSSWTKASMASIMTSMLPQQHNAEDFPDVLAPTLPKLSKLLKEQGYRTLATVCNPFLGREFGFADGFEQYLERPQDSAKQIVAESLKQLETDKNSKPFFLYVHVLDPHLPYNPPPQFRPKQSKQSFEVSDMKALREAWEADGPSPKLRVTLEQAKALYAGEISSCDHAFGQFIQELKKRGLYQNTLIVLVSDHGEQFFEHGMCDHMNSLYQELLHVPLIIKFPEQVAAGRVVESLWQHIDLAPTILAAAGIQAPIEMQGSAYQPKDPREAERPAYFSLKVGLDADRFGQSEGVKNLKAKAELEGIRVGPWVLQRANSTLTDLEPIQLFNLKDDPGEHRNLAYRRPDLRIWLLAQLGLKSRNGQGSSKASQASVDSSLKGLQYLR